MLSIRRQAGRVSDIAKAKQSNLLDSRRFSHNVRSPAYGEFEDKSHANEVRNTVYISNTNFLLFIFRSNG